MTAETYPKFVLVTTRKFIREYFAEQSRFIARQEEIKCYRTKPYEDRTEDQLKRYAEEFERELAYAELVLNSGLDPETATVDQVNALMSTNPRRPEKPKVPEQFQCDICEKSFELVIEFSDLGLDYDRGTAWICQSCIRDANAFSDSVGP